MSKSIKLSKEHGVNPSILKCFWCGEDIGVALLGALPNDAKAPHQIVCDYTPCDACIELMSQGITVMEVSNGTYTGAYVVITEESLDSYIADVTLVQNIKNSKKALMPSDLFRQFIKNLSEK